MERLWAPWRLQYVAADEAKAASEDSTVSAKPKGCIFCEKPKEDRDRENLIVLRGATCFVILNAFPYNNGHLMVVPYRHVDHPSKLTPEEMAEMMATTARMCDALAEVSSPDGYNIGMNVGSAAGAGIAAHLHLHIVPRWSGDTNFMPVLGDVKVLPELLTSVWDKLTAALGRDACVHKSEA